MLLNILVAATIAGCSLTSAQDEGPGTPVILWHGMGDSCCSSGQNRIKTAIEDNTLPGTYVHQIMIGDSLAEDTLNGFLKPINEQVVEVCDLVASDERFSDGYHAVGFSQGGQFLRAVAQRCPNPPMKSLVSIGGQHQGVFGFPRCPGETFELCNFIRELLNYGAYLDPVQNHLVQAQYWHDPVHFDLYVEKSAFLAEINNEKPEQDSSYAENLGQLENFVMVKFARDTMVEPRESEHFEFYIPGSEYDILPLRESPIYTEDRIGLKQLDESGRLVFLELEGDHLEFSIEWFIEEIVLKYLQ